MRNSLTKTLQAGINCGIVSCLILLGVGYVHAKELVRRDNGALKALLTVPDTPHRETISHSIGHIVGSIDGLKLIRHFEGLRLRAYRDVTGRWTVGVGDTHNVAPNMVISRREAETRLAMRYAQARREVLAMGLGSLSEGEIEALTSLDYNLGARVLGNSKLVSDLRAGNRTFAARDFLLYSCASKHLSNGLIRRRFAEASLFLSESRQ